MGLKGVTISDRAVQFGRSNGLVGIVTEPVESGPGDGGDRPPAFIIMNTGVTHRVGSNRMSTLWSRRLAALGHCVLRFDLPGLGDSERSADNLGVYEMALAAIREAVDWLAASRGIGRVVLAGLCSGADQSLLYAGSDPRIVGLVLIDPSIPPTRRFYLLYFWRRLGELDGWMGIFRLGGRALRALRGRGPAEPLEQSEYFRPMKLHDPRVHAVLAEAYQAALASDVAILAIFTAGVTFQHNYRTQLLDAFPEIAFGKQLHLEYFERCDHTFTLGTNRARLFAVTEAWLSRVSFRPAPPVARPAAADRPPTPVDPDGRVSVEF
jgi:pimeloyl-ACP methyl ester carboxylesterase